MEYKDTDTMKIMLFEISNLKGKDKFLTIAAVLADEHSLAILDFGSLPKIVTYLFWTYTSLSVQRLKILSYRRHTSCYFYERIIYVTV